MTGDTASAIFYLRLSLTIRSYSLCAKRLDSTDDASRREVQIFAPLAGNKADKNTRCNRT
jgi:hypothetical protein